MGADVSRVRFDPLRDFAGVVLQQGRLLLDARLQRVRRAPRPAAAGGDVRPHLVRPRPRPRRRRVGAAPDARRVPRHGLRRRAHDRPRPHVRRRAAGREPRRRRRSGSTRCSPSRPAPSTRRTTQQPYWPTPDPLPDRRPAPRLPRRLAARGHVASRIRTWSRSRSASTRPRARRPRGRCGCCRTSATRPAPPTTRTSPAGST